MGIPTAHISAIYGLALTTGSSRVIRGSKIEHICGDPGLGPQQDFAYGMRIVRTALNALKVSVEGPTLFDPADTPPVKEAAYAS